MSINGKRMYLWRTVDCEGEVLDILVQSRRNKNYGDSRRIVGRLTVYDRCSALETYAESNFIATKQPQINKEKTAPPSLAEPFFVVAGAGFEPATFRL